ncbi:Thiamine-monophosphate kinase [Tsuneonella dongtanensis]|uniref:Thiamine-monophosphate kinase n=1 Tax=Tsuneonella dongtanensis TaxID=692370 RepID=A0A1B2ACV3_9SPHN|nr:Thiamine-monophosphate kinase [Tsuneonella dongtanensis]
MIEGVHVRADEDPADIAWKLVAVNLSDLAAKGAMPVGVLLTHSLGPGDERFVEGLQEVLSNYDVPLLGGDTVRGTGARAWSCTAIGRTDFAAVPARSGARPGDAVYVTGSLGLAMLGMAEAERNSGSAADLAYRRPRPLLAEGRALAPIVNAMMDVSDGLLLDAFRIAQASRVTFDLDSATFPVADPERILACVTWGDDYQLVFTAAPDRQLPVAARRIGTVTGPDSAALRVDREIPDLARLGFEH